MKMEFLLSRVALIAVLAVVVGLVLNALALTLFAGLVSSLVLLIATGDYARGADYAAALAPAPATARRREALPLAG